ncbi:ArnT family glycosyltransferase [Methyloterricola oryzae]|uniref:ArnT family glycosyltransferase n=1 Tax=Methyloterricola oryzae TaxID=1495050 RepID=UPI00069B88CA|nr:glycosyltransferase family 39 protein [Methyloterricola oryzae]
MSPAFPFVMDSKSHVDRLKALGGNSLPWLVAAISLFLYLGDFALIAPDEGRNAEVAREMFEDGAWLVPTYDGLVYLDKPAFFFKSVALVFTVLGVNELAARLPSALCALALLAATHGFARREFDRRTADLAVVILATTPLYMAFARLVIFDMMLALFVCAAIFAGYRAETGPGLESARARWHLLAAVMGSLATLVKGPVGFVIPLLVLSIFFALERRRAALWRLFAPSHWLVFLGVVGPWFFSLVWQHPDFAYYGLIKESLARFGTAEFKRTQPFYFYGVVIAVGVFPWSLLLPEGVWRVLKRRTESTSAERLLMVWVAVVVLFFSLSQSKLPGYILSAVVALGLLLARFIAMVANDTGATLRRAAFALILVIGVGAIFLLSQFGGGQWLAKWTPAQWAPYAPSLRHLGISLALLALLAIGAALSARGRWVVAAFAALPLLPVTVNADLLRLITEGRSFRAMAQAMLPLSADVEVACLHCLPPGLPFYLQREIIVVTDDAREFTSNYVLYRLGSGPLDPARVVPLGQLRPWLKRSGHPIYLLANASGRVELEAIAKQRGIGVVQLGDRYWGALFRPPPAPVGH